MTHQNLRILHPITEVDLHTIPIDRYIGTASDETITAIKDAAEQTLAVCDGHIVWHINSTAVGGGVAEMLPSMLGYCRGLGIKTRWLVISGNPDFFQITKRLHHALHGESGDGTPLDEKARAIYEATMEANVDELLALIRPGDIVILHDPQTIGLAPSLSKHGARIVWRCHIGRHPANDEVNAAWNFLGPYLKYSPRYVFTRKEYVPDALDHGKSILLPPSLDAFTPKNQDMDQNTIDSILTYTGLVGGQTPWEPSLEFQRSDGSMDRINRFVDIVRCGAPPQRDRPLVIQVSRWDPLKDPVGVMHGFTQWLSHGGEDSGAELILAGPSVKAVADDPESPMTFGQVFTAWTQLPSWQRSRVHLAMLPMSDVEENAAIVNALQRHASVIVQKSLQEGFGLTVTEAMWKGRPVIASKVGGIQDQIEDGVHGLLLDDPTDLDAFAAAIGRLISDPELSRSVGEKAKERVRDHYLETRSVLDHLQLICEIEKSE